ncbi:GTPase activating Rap/RanGAP domain-like 1 [Jimgerdemannia flammicorona]|nr:GTPase activating Rap/RanGAP domain-like 1 [Jimgerdemannia flammicorona]
MKIGVIYVGPGQEDEQSILYNARGSNLYNDFVASIGWEVDLATHPGYLGGLERNLTNGARATYYCSSTVEMIFHDATKMPTDPNDPKQVRKKRHIGNDHVHIVWNEHHRDYRPGTIGGDFGNAQIIITPMLNGLFAIRVHRDQKVPFFGPLLNGMVVSRAVLGSLVRTTAMNAFRATLHPASQTMYRHMYAHRAGDIHIITQRHKVVKW